jgi:beta-lactamase superfamily II metal-dependent hydrolase
MQPSRTTVPHGLGPSIGFITMSSADDTPTPIAPLNPTRKKGETDMSSYPRPNTAATLPSRRPTTARWACVAIGVCAALASARPGRAAPPQPPVPAVDGQASALEPWSPGMMDIHHINTGRGNAAFFILPDGTTMVFDAGALADDWGEGVEPLQLGPALPDKSRRPGEWIADYIAQFAPRGMNKLDFAVISHFHTDHFGKVTPESPKSQHGDWKLAGITDVAERWPIATLIDRTGPAYDFPVALRPARDESLANYFGFVGAGLAGGRMKTEASATGRDDQIALQYDRKAYPTFSVRNVAANGAVWTGRSTKIRTTLRADQIVGPDGKFNENPLSVVLMLSYGNFDYVTGGDLTGVNAPDQPAWFNMESKIAPGLGEVDAITLNHHGNRDATNSDWLRILKPRVIVQQTWTSDHPGGDVVARMTSRKLWSDPRDIFATHIQTPTKIAVGPWLVKNYSSMDGHVVIRVRPGGATYDVFTLNDHDRSRAVKARFGPYTSRP